MKFLRIIVTATTLNLLATCFLFAQSVFPPKKYPADNYANPIDSTISLVGNFGECRPNHFHSGMDIRTNGKENYRLYAISDGYVSRVKIEAGGFGNAIYITHWDGYTSVYAHMNTFFVELETEVRQRQYKDKSWKQDIVFSPLQYPIKKRQFIGLSGNTGSSQGPHLHMEIRNTKSEAPLNGLLFYTKLKDTKAPTLKSLAIYDGSLSVYEQKPALIPLTLKGKQFRSPSDTLYLNVPSAILGIRGDDYMESATGTLGIYESRLYIEDKLVFAWQLDSIGYDITRYMNAHADYKHKKNGGTWIQFLHQLQGDQLPIYKSSSPKRGLIDLKDGKAKKVRIECLDAYSNKSVWEAVLIGNSTTTTDTTMQCPNRFKAGKRNSWLGASIQFTLAEDALYDDFCPSITTQENATNPYSYRYKVHKADIPIHSWFDLKLKPKQEIPLPLQEKIAIVRHPHSGESNKRGKAASYEQSWVKASVRDLGDYEIVIDRTPPTITSTIKNGDKVGAKSRITFVVKEETTTVATVALYLNNQWLRLVQKGDTYYYEVDDYMPSGRHQLTLTASDENNNTKQYTFTVTR